MLDVQADLLSGLATRVVVPLTPVAKLGGKPLTRLNPTIRVLGKDHVALFQELAAIPEKALRDPVASAGAHRTVLVAALDLFSKGI